MADTIVRATSVGGRMARDRGVGREPTPVTSISEAERLPILTFNPLDAVGTAIGWLTGTTVIGVDMGEEETVAFVPTFATVSEPYITPIMPLIEQFTGYFDFLGNPLFLIGLGVVALIVFVIALKVIF